MTTVKKTTRKTARSPRAEKAQTKIAEENIYGKITKTITQLSVAMVALVAVFSPDNAWILGPIIGSLAIMGIALGYFSSKQ